MDPSAPSDASALAAAQPPIPAAFPGAWTRLAGQPLGLFSFDIGYARGAPPALHAPPGARARSELLETTIIVLIAVELLILLAGWG